MSKYRLIEGEPPLELFKEKFLSTRPGTAGMDKIVTKDECKQALERKLSQIDTWRKLDQDISDVKITSSVIPTVDEFFEHYAPLINPDIDPTYPEGVYKMANRAARYSEKKSSLNHLVSFNFEPPHDNSEFLKTVSLVRRKLFRLRDISIPQRERRYEKLLDDSLFWDDFTRFAARQDTLDLFDVLQLFTEAFRPQFTDQRPRPGTIDTIGFDLVKLFCRSKTSRNRTTKV
jgi:hypothetical protein